MVVVPRRPTHFFSKNWSAKAWRRLGCKVAKWCCVKLLTRSTVWSSVVGRNPIGFRVRAVAFGNAQSPRNVSRDRDMEVVWCSEFERLRTLVAAAGGGIEIEHALPDGATPLKLIEDQRGRERTDEVRTPKTMQR
jgi:hypothetical protein